MFAYRTSEYASTGHGEAKRVRAVMATAGIFSTLQVHPALGREFFTEENRKGADHVVVLSYGLWQAEFAGAADAIGRTIEFDSEPYTIIGVMPAGFHFPLAGNDAYLPIGFDDKVMTQRGAHYLSVLGRLKAESPRRRPMMIWRVSWRSYAGFIRTKTGSGACGRSA